MTATSPSKIPPALRRAAGPALLALLLLAGGWWILSMDRVEERVRNEEVEMFDLAVPPPPPPPPPEIVQPKEVEKVTVQAETVQRDPLTPPDPATTNPPAGDLTSLMQDPVGDTGAFTGGARGQGGTGKGSLIGGTSRGGGSSASRAYAELIQRAIMRHLRREADLAQAQFEFRVNVRVSGDGGLEILGLSNVQPPALEEKLLRTLRSLNRVDTPPPAGMPNQITLQLNQA
ncbi:hypothetical protein L6Q21_00360 [Sandaracinobacter sp. RS1-74]|uniref:hypothetical protein n=1 Tax=Sandaracinobacteroides sayramensis TaxID=2913411 RepID=UPI001EDB82E2|nr:hypothetical protein [Sandaracinobacteroides sayramensis]MCG2839427.1 hypothetical protein [Sandaracinobacteroides sayramensis]